MELERLSIALRPRNPWEALDLGVRLVMRNLRAVYAAWLSVTLPCAILIIGVLGIGMNEAGWALLLMWWLRPAFDRVVLHVVSHAVFDEVPSVRNTLRALPTILSPLRVLPGLLWRRFSMQRSLRLPVDMLEGLRGAAARQRRTLISRRVSSAAIWQCIAWQTLEMILTLGLLGLCILLIPREMLEQFDWQDFLRQGDNARLISQLAMVLYVLCHLALEPLYVAGGFMLYLKRRNDLEAWDVELQFRRLARAHAAARAGAALFTMLVAFTLALGPALPTPANAAEPDAAAAQAASQQAGASDDDDEPAADAEDNDADEQATADKADDDPSRSRAIGAAADHIKHIMQGPDFGKDETRSVLRWRRNDNADRKPWNLPDWLSSWFGKLAELLSGLGGIFASVGRFGGWLLISAVALGLLHVVLRYWRGWTPTHKRAVPLAELAGFDIRPQSLPADVAAAALALLREGRTREAMSLLFRGALSVLAHRDHVPFTRGDTEGDCLDRVRQHANARFVFLARLLAKWQELAYAHRIIATNEVEQLCMEWPKHFANRQESSRG